LKPYATLGRLRTMWENINRGLGMGRKKESVMIATHTPQERRATGDASHNVTAGSL